MTPDPTASLHMITSELPCAAVFRSHGHVFSDIQSVFTRWLGLLAPGPHQPWAANSLWVSVAAAPHLESVLMDCGMHFVTATACTRMFPSQLCDMYRVEAMLCNSYLMFSETLTLTTGTSEIQCGSWCASAASRPLP